MITLNELGLKHGTDKGTLHSYLDIYELYAAKYRRDPLNILEIGTGRGSSIRMWLEYFPNATVKGIDDNPEHCKNPPDRAHYYCGKQDDLYLLNRILHHPEEQFDVIIDDGSHVPEDQILTFHYLWEHLKQGGLYFIEDVCSDIEARYWGIPGAMIYPNHKEGRVDDILVVIRKS